MLYLIKAEIYVSAETKPDAIEHLHNECAHFFGLDNNLIAIESADDCEEVTGESNEDERAETCECGMTEQGVWSEALFEQVGCECD